MRANHCQKIPDKMKENSRIETSPTEDDVRDYMSVVMNELKIGENNDDFNI